MNLTHQQTCERLHEINARQERLSEQGSISTAEQREFDRLADEFDTLNNHRKRLQMKSELAGIGSSGGSGRYRTVPGAIGDDSDDYDRDHGGLDHGLRNRAMRTLDRHVE